MKTFMLYGTTSDLKIKKMCAQTIYASANVRLKVSLVLASFKQTDEPYNVLYIFLLSIYIYTHAIKSLWNKQNEEIKESCQMEGHV
jgi:hypothetical protein